MVLKRIEIRSFGKLNQYTLELDNGLQVLFGGNESGKSTLLAFLTLVFYRGETGGPRQSLRAAYAPWSGQPMGGAVEFIHHGVRYRLDKTIGERPELDEVRLRNLDSGEEQTLGPKEEAGERFLGLDREAFIRTCLMGREDWEDVSREGTASAGEERGEPTGEEIAAFQKADNGLGTVEAGLSLFEADLSPAFRTWQLRLKSALRVKEELQRLEEELDRFNAGRLQQLRQKEECLAEREKLEADYARKQSGWERRKQRVQDQVDMARRQVDILLLMAGIGPPPYFIVAAVLLALGFVAATILLRDLRLLVGMLLPVALLVLHLNEGATEVVEQERWEVTQLKLEQAKWAQVELLETLERQERLYRDQIEAVDQRLRLLQKEAEVQVEGEDRLRWERAVQELRQADEEEESARADYLRQVEAFNQLLRREEGMPVLSEIGIESEVVQAGEYLRVKRDRLRREVGEMLERAGCATGEEYRQRFVVERDRRRRREEALEKQTGQILSALTGNSFAPVRLDPDGSVWVETGGVYRRMACFSDGFIAQLRLALRLAVLRLDSPEGAPLPLFLDDTLLPFDDQRTARSLRYLAEGRDEPRSQTVLFTGQRHICEKAAELGVGIRNLHPAPVREQGGG